MNHDKETLYELTNKHAVTPTKWWCQGQKGWGGGRGELWSRGLAPCTATQWHLQQKRNLYWAHQPSCGNFYTCLTRFRPDITWHSSILSWWCLKQVCSSLPGFRLFPPPLLLKRLAMVKLSGDSGYDDLFLGFNAEDVFLKGVNLKSGINISDVSSVQNVHLSD